MVDLIFTVLGVVTNMHAHLESVSKRYTFGLQHVPIGRINPKVGVGSNVAPPGGINYTDPTDSIRLTSIVRPSIMFILGGLIGLIGLMKH